MAEGESGRWGAVPSRVARDAPVRLTTMRIGAHRSFYKVEGGRVDRWSAGPVDGENARRWWWSVSAILALAWQLALSNSAFAQASEAPPYRDASRPVAERVR